LIPDSQPEEPERKVSSTTTQDYHPSIQQMLAEIEEIQAEWNIEPAPEPEPKLRRLSGAEILQLRKSGQMARNRRSISKLNGEDQPEEEGSTSDQEEKLPERFASIFPGAEEGGYIGYPEPDLVQPEQATEVAKSPVKKVPRKPVMQSFIRHDLQLRSQGADLYTSARPSQMQARQPNETDLFASHQKRDHKRNYDKGKRMAGEIAKDFWSKHANKDVTAKDRPSTKELLESLFHHAPADLHPCPERLQFLGIQPSRHGLFR